MFNRETKILIALLIVLAGLVVYRVATREEPKRVKELTYKPGASQGAGVRGRKQEAGTQEVVQRQDEGMMRPETLKIEKKPYRGVVKNLFRPLYPPPPPPPVVAQKAVFPVITTKGPSPAQIESARIKFLGFLQREGDRKIFLSKDKDVFIVKKGDNIGSYQVGDITDSGVTLIFKDTKEEFRLTIEDNKPTKPGMAPMGGRR